MDFDCYWKWFELVFNEMNENWRLKLIKDVLNLLIHKLTKPLCRFHVRDLHRGFYQYKFYFMFDNFKFDSFFIKLISIYTKMNKFFSQVETEVR
jgi:hypothetical protein